MNNEVTKLYYDMWDTVTKTPFDLDTISLACKRVNHLISNYGKQHTKWDKLKCKLFGHAKEFEAFNHYPDIDKDDFVVWYRCPRCGLK